MGGLMKVAVGGVIAVVIVMGIITGTTTTSWNSTVATLFPYIGLGTIAFVLMKTLGGGKKGD